MRPPRPVVPCQAVVDRLGFDFSRHTDVFAVTVTARLPLIAQRVYTVEAVDEDHAAREGLQRFQQEMGFMMFATPQARLH